MGREFTQIKRSQPDKAISINHPATEVDHIVNVIDKGEIKVYVNRKGQGQIRLK
ncbi:MAG: hypothetical protein KAR39_08780 [Thermoplasmata archaeon]|nr:hypothetical protein [Thermoplasmata archaeon]